jgi:hypothetical protein
LFGDGFVLLSFGKNSVDASKIVDAATARCVPLVVPDLSNGHISELYERELVLVRPDGHVAWRGNACPDDVLMLIDRVRGASTP